MVQLATTFWNSGCHPSDTRVLFRSIAQAELIWVPLVPLWFQSLVTRESMHVSKSKRLWKQKGVAPFLFFGGTEVPRRVCSLCEIPGCVIF